MWRLAAVIILSNNARTQNSALYGVVSNYKVLASINKNTKNLENKCYRAVISYTKIILGKKTFLI